MFWARNERCDCSIVVPDESSTAPDNKKSGRTASSVMAVSDLTDSGGSDQKFRIFQWDFTLLFLDVLFFRSGPQPLIYIYIYVYRQCDPVIIYPPDTAGTNLPLCFSSLSPYNIRMALPHHSSLITHHFSLCADSLSFYFSLTFFTMPRSLLLLCVFGIHCANGIAAAVTVEKIDTAIRYVQEELNVIYNRYEV